MSGSSRLALAAFSLLALASPAPAVAPEIKDEAKFFSADAVKKANEIIYEIASKYDRDLLIETFAAVPGDEAEREKVKKMSREEKLEFFRKWAVKRAGAAAANGVYILICKDPTYIKIEYPKKGRSEFDAKVRAKVQEVLLSEFRERRYDEGLLAAVKVVRDRYAAAK
jgi:uncharacterized membrane protein YgcG